MASELRRLAAVSWPTFCCRFLASSAGTTYTQGREGAWACGREFACRWRCAAVARHGGSISVFLRHCVCVSLRFCVSASLWLCVFRLCFSVSLCSGASIALRLCVLCLSVFKSGSLRLGGFMPRVSACLCVCRFLYVCVRASGCPCVAVCLYVCVSMCLRTCASVSACLCLVLVLFVCMCGCVSGCVNVSCLFVRLFLRVCLFLNLCAPVLPYLRHAVPSSASKRLRMCVCMLVCLCASAVFLHRCVSVSLRP